MKLSENEKVFISRWGEMGVRWGVGKSVAAVHALLYLAREPLTAEEISETLNTARSNVSSALKELEAWNLVFRESKMGDRKSFYRCESDVWQMARCILVERRKRETEGAIRAVRECRAAAASSGDAFVEKRMKAMEEILSDCCAFSETALKFDNAVLRKALRAAGTILRRFGK